MSKPLRPQRYSIETYHLVDDDSIAIFDNHEKKFLLEIFSPSRSFRTQAAMQRTVNAMNNDIGIYEKEINEFKNENNY